MKLLHINSYYSMSSFYKNLYEKQIDNGLDIDVFVPVPSTLNISGLDLGGYAKISKNHNKYDRLFFYLKQSKIYKDIIRSYKINEFNLVHSHSLFSNGYIALKLKKDYKIPYVVAVRNTDVNTFFKYMIHLRRLGIQILKEADKIIFLSEAYRKIVIEKHVPDKYKKNISEKSIVIPNGIDDFWLKNKSNGKNGPKKDKIKLVYAGVIDKNKNLLTTAKAIEVLKKSGFEPEFTVVGRVIDKSVFEKIKKMPFVKYIEPVDKDELIRIYRNNDIFVMPSIHETFGLVYAEAMSQGLPVIYTKGQGFDNQFDEGVVGYHVDCYSEDDIANKIIKVTKEYKKNSLNCIKLVDKFNWIRIVEEYNKIYG